MVFILFVMLKVMLFMTRRTTITLNKDEDVKIDDEVDDGCG